MCFADDPSRFSTIPDSLGERRDGLNLATLPVDSETASQMAPADSRRALIALPFGLAIVAIVLTYWTIDIVSPALPEAKDDLALSAAAAGLVYSLMFLGRLLGNFPATLLLPRIGTTGTSIAGGAVLIVATVIVAFSPNVYVIYPARVMQGIGIAFLVNATLRAVIGARPDRGAAMTYFSFAATVGGVFGLQSGGFLTENYGWRSVFYLSIVIAVIVTGMSAFARFRPNGALDLAPTPVALAEGGGQSTAIPVLLNFLVFFNYSVFVALPLYAEHTFAASPEANARLLMVITVVHMVATFPAGRAIRTWGAQRCLAGGMVISVFGTALVLPMPSLLWIAAPLILYGVGQVTATSAGGDIVLHLGGQSPKSVSLVRFSSDLGLVVGPYVTGALTDAFGYGAPFVGMPLLLACAAVYALHQAHAAGDRRI